MMITALIAGAIGVVIGVSIGMSLDREERARLWNAIEEWAAAKREVPPLSRVPAGQYLRLRRAEAVLQSLVAEDELDGDTRP